MVVDNSLLFTSDKIDYAKLFGYNKKKFYDIINTHKNNKKYAKDPTIIVRSLVKSFNGFINTILNSWGLSIKASCKKVHTDDNGNYIKHNYFTLLYYSQLDTFISKLNF